MDRYLTKTPEPLDRQFPDRVSKEEAVKGYKERKQMKKAPLFPAGKFTI